jgi:DNA-directed RNA polymerase subunit RPC12/RpoP/UDP-2,3-diacylglucosamine pyrophosphatase LpxH
MPGIEIICHHCKTPNTYKGKNRYFNCHKCGYKIFLNSQQQGLDPTKIAQGLGILNLKLKTDNDRIRIIPWGDIHVGAPDGQCDWAKACREIKYVLDNPDTYLLGMGDYMDCAQKMTGRGPNLFASSLMPMEQLQLMEQVLTPLAEKGKIIGLLGGNHEEWIMQQSGIQIIDLLCRKLRIPYLGAACSINIQANKQKYALYALHGSGNAQLKHTKIGRLINVSKDIFADVLIMGHVHQLAVTKGGKYQLGKTHKAYYITTGHFLNWVGSYAQAFGLDVCPSGCPKITLFTERKDVHVSL